MADNSYSNDNIFRYDFICPNENSLIRYGVAKCHEKSARAVLLLLHGRGEFMEKYQLIAKLMTQKGFLVISMDWRGQGLSCRELANRQKGHVTTFDDYISDLEFLYSNIASSYNLPVYILAHSMGGHTALRFMSLHPFKIEKAVLISPMIDIALPSGFKPVAERIAKLCVRLLFAGQYAIGARDYTAEKIDFKKNRLCHDLKNYMILHNEIRKNPDLALGGPTWGWLNAAFDSIRILKQNDVINKITTPILMITAQNDSVVSVRAQTAMSRRLPRCRQVVIKGGFHELLFETHDIICQIWDAIDEFITQV